ncbi:oxidoreductase [Secundilactobacillus paracollinoides]|uniref:NAD(P)/FAD-dependent oxidoreductase n=1 Tax=Secundilactobacillus paracollinoides TaxID=240427 RepID=UPI00081A6B47|nr:FAD-dependent oxidoreductase [Secundilactobacillus paracollinoides]ANZ63769.1 oxidoreductase [Secundilactobacillus paracollinoides]
MKRKIAIIGGGIVGASAAYYLSTLSGHDQLEVTLYDDGTGQATSAAAGIISPWLSKRRNSQWYQLAKDGASLLMQLARQANLATDVYAQTGTIITRTDPTDMSKLWELAKQRAADDPDMGEIAQLTAEQVQEKIPLLSKGQPGVLVSGGARIDGAKFVTELLQQASQVNLTVKHGRVQLDEAGRVITPAGLKRFDELILAAGAWLPDLVAPLGIKVAVRPQKGQLIRLNVQDIQDYENMPVLMPEGERDVIPLGHGELIVGATHDDEGKYDLSVTDEATQDLLGSAQRFVSGLTADSIAEAKVGTRAYTEDHSPFFGRLPKHPKILVASGLGASGLTTGPLIGRLLAGTAIYGGQPDWSKYEKNLANYFS